MSTSIAYGAKYDAKLGTREIAQKVREEIKAAVKAGSLPKARYSVRMDRFSGGSSIDVKISKVEEPGFSLYNLERLAFEIENPHKVWSPGYDPARPHRLAWTSERASELLAQVEKMLQAYNFDGSDSQTDYFHVKFYGHVSFDTSDGERDAAIASLRAGIIEAGSKPIARFDVAAFEAAAEDERLEKLATEERRLVREESAEPAGEQAAFVAHLTGGAS